MSKAILGWLNSLPECKALKRHMNEHTEAGSPDIEGCILVRFAGRTFGQHFEIETKKDGGQTKASRKRLQAIRADQWEATGALVLRDVTSLAEVQDTFFAHGLVTVGSPSGLITIYEGSVAPCETTANTQRKLRLK